MSVPTVVFTALGPLVGNRMFPNAFPQVEGGYSNWPAIRSTVINSDNAPTICGTDTAATDDVRMQFDIVAQSYVGMLSLRDAAIAALMGLTPPAVRQGLSETFDAETKTHRAMLDFTFHQSSP